MKKSYILYFTLVLALFFNACNYKKQKTLERNSQVTKNTDSLAIEKPYLGQKVPGLIPIRFAPDIVSTEHYEYSGVFTPDMKEFYLIREGGKFKEAKLVVFKYKDKKWLESEVSSWVGQPVISPDGKTMHLGRRYKNRVKNGWSELKELEAPFKDLSIMRLSSSNKGTYYFDTYDKEKPDFPIRFSRLINGKYETPKALGKSINTGIKNINHPFIAPDESYLIWDTVKEEGYGKSDIYISFKLQDGSWSTAINLGDKINTSAWEASASVTPDGKYLFFNRNMGSDKYENVDIFWVDAKIIESLRPRI